MKFIIELIAKFKGVRFEFIDFYKFPYRFTWEDDKGIHREMSTDKFVTAFNFALKF